MKSKKWLISLGLAVVLVVALALPACTGEPEEQARRLNIGFPDETSLNMDITMLMGTEIGCLYSMICYETLSTYARVGEEDTEDPYVFKPGLITSYEVFEDQERYCPIREANVTVQVWRLHVREGVKWHDFDTSGNYVTAEDIKWTLENHSSVWEYDKPVTWDLYFNGYGNISAEEYLEFWIEIPDEEDPYTIDFVHDTPVITSTFPSWWTWEPIVPKHKFEGEEYPQEAHGDHIGSGAFKFVSYESGDYYRFERNDDWWGWDENGGEYEGEVEELFFNLRPDTGAWLMAVENGDDDWIQSPPPAALPDLEADPDIQVYVAEGIGVYYLGFNHFVQPVEIEPGVWQGYRDYDMEEGEPVWGYGGPYLKPELNPLHDKVLREAIAYAINVTAMIDLVNDGYGELANSWVYTDSPAYNDELEWYLFDDDKAEQMLLDEGYYKDGEGWWVSNYTDEKIELTLTSDTTAIFYAWSQMVWEQLRDFGIDVSLTTMEPGAMTSALYDPVGGGLELFISGDHPANDPYSRWIWWYGLDQWWGEWNPTYWYNTDFEALFPQLYWEGEESYDDVIKGIQEVFHGDIPMYMMMRPNSIVAYRTDKWEGWYEQMGGVVLWNNPFSLLDLKWVGPE